MPFLRHVWLEEGFGTLEALAVRVPDAVLDAAEDDVTPDDRMVIVHTSGSTSAPKGVLHQHGSLLGHLESLNRLRGLDPGVRLFSNSPMFWVGGLAYNIVGVLVAGATLLCSASLDPAETLDFIERERPELTNGFVASIAALVAHPSFLDARLLVDPWWEPPPACCPTPSGPRTRSSGTTCSVRPRPAACA